MSATLDQFYLDLFTTALEGGINYWAQCAGYHWFDTPNDRPDFRGFYADIIDMEDDSEPCYVVDRSVISRGYRLASGAFRKSLNWSSEPPPAVITGDTDWDFDASDADMVLQLGLFGNVVYG